MNSARMTTVSCACKVLQLELFSDTIADFTVLFQDDQTGYMNYSVLPFALWAL